MAISEQESEWFFKELDRYLLKHSLKQTQQRRKIIEYFLKLNTHLDAEELHRSMQKDGMNLGLATIYRTLHLLKAAGLVEQKAFADGRAIFEINHPNEHHDHLVCMQCGLVFEFESEEIERIQKQIASKLHFELTDHRLDMFGKCLIKNCQRRKAQKKTVV